MCRILVLPKNSLKTESGSLLGKTVSRYGEGASGSTQRTAVIGMRNKIRMFTAITIISLVTLGLSGAIFGLIPHPSALPVGAQFDNIVVIAMENQNYADVLGSGTGSSNAPFLGSLLPSASTIPQYHSYGARSTISGCSASCYVAFMAGYCCVTDGYGTINVPNLMNPIFSNAGLTWKAFCENGCPRGNDHFPFTAFSNIQNSPNIVVTSNDFTSTTNNPVLAEMNSATPSNLIWLTPTDNHNMHDNTIQTGDAYLQQLLVGTGTVSNPSPGSLFSTNLLKSSRTLLYIWWDEYDPSPNLLLGSMVKKGFISTSNNYDEYDSLRTIESNWNLPTITSNDAGAPPMSDLFGASGPIPLTTGFSFGPFSPIVGQTVTFTATTVGGTAPYTIAWKFGDGSNGTGTYVTHAYTSAQTFTVTETATDSSSPQQTATASKAVTAATVPTYPNCSAPIVTTTDLVVGGGTLATGGFTPGIANKRSTTPPCSVNGIPMYIRILNVTLTNIANGAASGDCNPINGVIYCDSTADALSFGSTKTVHIEIDQAWKAAGIAPADFPTNGSRIDITGFAYWDVDHGCCWEMHPVSAWTITAQTTTGDFGVCTPLPQGWNCGNTNGLTGSSANIVNGVLQTRESNPGVGSDNSYYFSTTQKGTFPWSPCQAPASGVLSPWITSVSTTFTPLTITASGSYRYHIYVALYYWLPNGAVSARGSTYRCLDTQVRVENIGGTFSPLGSTATYNPGDSFGWDQVTIGSVSIGGAYTLTANVQQQCQQDEAAWGIPTSTTCQLAGIEIGTEGYQFQQLDVNWFTVSLAVSSSSTPDFTINASPYTLTVQPGSSATSQIQLVSLNGFSGTVSLTATSSSGLNFSLSQASLTLSAGSSQTATITVGVLPAIAMGTYSLTLRATSGSLVHSQRLTITATYNKPPSVIVPGPQSSYAGSSIRFIVNATDPDLGETITLTVTGLPPGASFDPATGEFSWTPLASQAGAYNVTFTATDNGNPPMSSSNYVLINVESGTQPPPPSQGQGTCLLCQITQVTKTNTWLLVTSILAGFMLTLTVVYLRARGRLHEARRTKRLTRCA